MKIEQIFLLIIVVVSIIVAAYFLMPEPVPETTGMSSEYITIRNFAFIPATLTISPGSSVVWTNEDSTPHIIKGKDFQSSTLQNGENFVHTFNKPGTYEYYCTIHLNMKGVIIVE